MYIIVWELFSILEQLLFSTILYLLWFRCIIYLIQCLKCDHVCHLFQDCYDYNSHESKCGKSCGFIFYFHSLQ